MNGEPWELVSGEEDDLLPEEAAQCDHLMEILQAAGTMYGETEGESPFGFARYVGLRITPDTWVALVLRRPEGASEDPTLLVLTKAADPD